MTQTTDFAARRRARASSLAFLTLAVTFITGCPGTPGATPAQTAGGMLGAALPAAAGAPAATNPINGLMQAAFAPPPAAGAAATAAAAARTATSGSPASPQTATVPRSQLVASETGRLQAEQDLRYLQGGGLTEEQLQQNAIDAQARSAEQARLQAAADAAYRAGPNGLTEEQLQQQEIDRERATQAPVFSDA